MDTIQPKALLFDMGGVVLDVDFDRVFQHWAQFSPLSQQQMKDQFRMDEAYELHEKGQISAAQYFEHLRIALQMTGSDAQILTGWNAIFGSEITTTFDCIDAVRGKLPVLGFTNTNRAHQDFWEQQFPRIRTTFDHLFVSSEIGLRKPSADAFNFILDSVSVEPAEMLFYDDTPENIHGAENLGIQTVLVTGPESVKSALSQFS